MIEDRPSWHADAACRGMGSALFFPSRGESHANAQAVCAGCPTREPCRQAGEHEYFGVWAGASERQRRLRRHLRVLAFDADGRQVAS